MFPLENMEMEYFSILLMHDPVFSPNEMVFDEAFTLGKINIPECQFIGDISLDRYLAGN